MHLAADGIEDHIDIGQRFGEIGGVVIDHLVGAEAGDVIVVAGTGRGDHVGANMMSDLDADAADAAGTALDQKPLPGGQMSRVFQRDHGGQCGKRQGCRLIVADRERL